MHLQFATHLSHALTGLLIPVRINGIGGETNIEGRGDVRALISNGSQTTTITLRNCAHVPSFSGNLLSIKVIDRAGGSATFKNGKATIFGPDGKELGVGQRTEHGGLYKMDIQGLPSKEQAHTVRGDASGAKTWEDWHRIYGHLNQAALERLHSKNLVDGMRVITSSPRNYFCETCIKAKHHVAPFPSESTTEYQAVGEITVADVWGPARTTSLQGNRYFVSFTDAYSRFSTVAFMKSTSEVLQHYKAYEALVETQHGRKLKRVRTDNGKEFVNAALRTHAAQQGTILEETAPYSSSQNGIAERKMRTLVESARAALEQHNLPLFLWQESVAYMAYLKNRSPTRALSDATPYELFMSRKPFVRDLQEFGSECWVLDQSGKVSKLDPKSRKYRFTGFAENSRSWRYYKHDTKNVLKSRNVVFAPRTQSDLKYAEFDPEELQMAISPAEGEELEQQRAKSILPTPKQPEVPQTTSETAPPILPTLSTPEMAPAPKLDPPNEKRVTRGNRVDYTPFFSGRGSNIPKPVGIATLSGGNAEIESEWVEWAYAAIQRHDDDDHPTHKQTLTRWDSDKWQGARDEEIGNFVRFETFELVHLPPGCHALKAGWVYVIKRDANGVPTRYKARLVVKGYAQRQGIDYAEVFAHVLRGDSWP
ncbi:Retrovirus-related Pol polyprotein [Ceratobasidium theobromae]|uniref:Retrovirus-related Pol polyprotein n=1 Tax=Ceratobasidium theobromae TaxID=1582974 RepID=A0A5N5Q780_9AGAM|nr:Retrovirus-related Pol polyprotein [Ceratobasidium theobromae]